MYIVCWLENVFVTSSCAHLDDCLTDFSVFKVWVLQHLPLGGWLNSQVWFSLCVEAYVIIRAVRYEDCLVVYVCSRDFETVLMSCLDDGFCWLTDQIAEYFKPCASNGMTPSWVYQSLRHMQYLTHESFDWVTVNRSSSSSSSQLTMAPLNRCSAAPHRQHYKPM